MDISPIKPDTPDNGRFPGLDDGKFSQGMDISANFSPIQAMSTPASDRIISCEPDATPSPSIILGPHSSTSSIRSNELSYHATPTKMLFYADHHYKTPTTRLMQSLKNNSPLFKTPSSGRSTISNRMLMTPHSAQTPSSSSLSTPGSARQKKIYNPFDTLDYLSQPMASPNMFATRVAPEEESPGPFHWNIEHLAELFPVEIDEMPTNQAPKPDLEKELKAQEAIERYFEQHEIVPSPWMDEKTRPVFQLPCTPNVADDSEEKSSLSMKDPEKSKSSPPSKKQEAAVQTMLSLPVDFDIQKVLGEYVNEQMAIQDKSGSPSDLSSSSLRRKLFFHGDQGTPLSPVSKSKDRSRRQTMEFVLSPPVSPVKCKTPVRSRRSADGIPGSSQFSSSPIASGHMSCGLRRCSTAPDLAGSPTSNGARVQATPSSGARSSPPDSPNMSPIRQTNGDSSYTDSSETCSFSISQGARRKVCRKPRVKPSEEQLATDNRKMSNCQRRLMSEPCFGNNDSNMEVEEDSNQIPNDKRASVSLPSYLPTETTQLNNHSMEDNFSGYRSHHTKLDNLTSDDVTSQTQGFISQDTGYISHSLQSNCDPSLHTNLTNQFNSSPWMNHDSEKHSESDVETNEPTPPRQPAIFREIFHGPNNTSSLPIQYDKSNNLIHKGKDTPTKFGDKNGNDSVGMLSDEENESCATEVGQPLQSWTPLLNTPQRQTFQNLGVMSEDTGLRIKPSEVAERVLQRANEDFHHYFGDYLH